VKESIYYNCLTDIAFENLPMRKSKEERLLELNNGIDFLKDKLKEYLLKSYSTDVKKNIYIDLHIQKILFATNFTINNIQPVTYFLNFNYTPTIERYIDNEMKIKYNIDIINIHGQINEKDTLIFGYGDEMENNYEKIEHKNNNEYLRHFKSFGYLKNIRLSKLLSFIEADSFNVYIMGHSCGISDRLLLNTIFQNENCKIIKIFYYKIDESKNDFVEKTMEISRSFTLAGKAKMRKRIVPFDQCEPLTK
jgi:Bacteriophage abortive infection AbiH